ncbi:Outer membrane protein Omp28 [Tenacibaculum sp. MAR_2009_124]|uniref:Omp28-related outer membrane protein n=1 Tax=Tenacibaculum sp. MAR_2009_124 TaxID=1250059 RepID=UPI00089677BF|nr:Omp28-related outer membrane protein [Tenacibaculum sp. MAR_2009_124]SEB98298.1 Outer membrane protein Omp28 [Tenacibaculum sp. MAR_2009_124]
MKFLKKNIGVAIIAIVIIMFSCSNENIQKDKTELKVVNYNSGNIVFVGEEVVLEVKKKVKTSPQGNTPYYIDKDISEEAIIYVNEERIQGNKFIPTDVSTYKVKAIYEGEESMVLQLGAQLRGNVSFKKNIVIEDYTGDWCGYCPRVSYAMELLKSKTDQFIPIAVHDNDVMTNAYGNQLIRYFDIIGFPSAMIDRKGVWREAGDIDETEMLDKITNRVEGKSFLGLKLISRIDHNNILLNINVLFGNMYSNKTKLVVFATEDGIVQDQANYTAYYPEITTEGIAKDFVHDYVLRYALTDVRGDEMKNNQFISNNIFERNFQIEVPLNINNLSKVNFVAMVLDSETNEVLNARFVKAGESNEFEFLN